MEILDAFDGLLRRLGLDRAIVLKAASFAMIGVVNTGIDFGVSPMPGIDGKPAHPFVGVSVAYVNRASLNTNLIRYFLQSYLLTDRYRPLLPGPAEGIVANHPFVDGNKRTGFAALFMFLALNGAQFDPPEVDATMGILRLAAGDLTDDAFIDWVRSHTRLPP